MELSAPTSSVKELKEIAVDSIDFVVNGVKKDWQEFATKYNFAFKEYFEAKSKTLSKIKPIFSSQSIDLKEIYVPQNIILNSTIYKFSEINEVIENNKKLILLGTAGAGKSCLSKTFFLETIQNKSYFPIFYELRKLNETGKTIFDSLVDDIANFNSKFSKENLSFILKRKGTLLILDGFDEINFDKKREYFKEITYLAEIYPDLRFIVSSRAEDGLFNEWNLFTVAKLQQLNLEQACEVIDKLNYDIDVKRRFLKSLKETLFEKHEDFVSNPLLLNIMLFTYEQNGEIPNEMHIFYDQAYQVLFNRHDSYKQGFVRKSLTNLDMQRFKIIFSLFCLTTYCKQQFEFSSNELKETLRKCLDATENKSVSEEKLRKELLSNVPLMIQDGINFCFAHRSFQEYFTAFYLTHKQDIKYDVFDIACKRLRTDSVASMLFDMNKANLENKWILPKIKSILTNVNNLDTYDARIKNMELFYDDIWIRKDEENNEIDFCIVTTQTISFINFLQNRYPLKMKNPTSKLDSDENLEKMLNILGDTFESSDLDEEQIDFFLENDGDIIAKNYIDYLKKLEKIITEQQNSSDSAIDDLIFN